LGDGSRTSISQEGADTGVTTEYDKLEVLIMDVIVPLVTLPLVYLAVLAAGILPWVLLRRKKMTTLHRVATLATAIPPVVPGILNVFFFVLLHRDFSNPIALVAMGLITGAVLASAGFAIARKGEIAKDIGVGTGIAIIVGIFELELPHALFPAIFPPG